MKRGGGNAGNRNPHHRHYRQADRPDTRSTHRCPVCHKDSFVTKDAAKRVARAEYPRTHTWPVHCPAGNGWHYTSVKPGTTEEEPS